METDRIKPSKTNPRGKDFGDLDSLAASIKVSGILQPLLVRPIFKPNTEDPTGQYEIIAGERRWRAAKVAGMPSVPVIVHDVIDTEAETMQIVENLQREDIHPMDEARAYAKLRKSGESATTIARMVGKTPKFVTDRLYLLDLIPDLAAAFRENVFSPAHARVLSRIPKAAQEKAVASGLYRPTLDDKKVAISLAELLRWVDAHVRVSPESLTVENADLFPQAHEKLKSVMYDEDKALAKPKTVVAITHEHYVQEDARDKNERTIGPRSWKPAGKHTTCSGAAIGVVAVGTDRGKALDVCIDKACKTHWAAELKEKAKRAKSTDQKDERTKWKEQEEKDAAERVRLAAYEGLWKRATPRIIEAILPKIIKGTVLQLGPILLGAVDQQRLSGEAKRDLAREMPKAKTMENVARYAVAIALTEQVTSWQAYRDFPKVAKSLGVDTGKIVAALKAEEAKATEKK
jgi:ParB family chromosome partitioning protein